MKIFYSLSILLITAAKGFSQTDCQNDCPCIQESICPVSSIQIGGNYTYAQIKIHDHHSFHGNLGGVQGIYEYKPRNNIYGALKASWKEGKTNGHRADREIAYVDVQERLGYTFACRNRSLTLFSGFGYKFLGHKLKQHRHHTIKFEYNEFYIPLGFLSNYSFNACWTLGLNFTWMPQVYPTVKIVPLKGARWVIKDKINNFLVELPLTYLFSDNKRFSLILKPFYERWEDGASTARTFAGNPLGLPGNTYNFYGVELNFAFAF